MCDSPSTSTTLFRHALIKHLPIIIQFEKESHETITYNNKPASPIGILNAGFMSRILNSKAGLQAPKECKWPINILHTM